VDDSGVMIPPVEDITVQKYDSQFGTNVVGARVIVYPLHMQADVPIDECVGHWLFTKLLLPALFAATDASPTREKARVVTVSSSANYFAKEIDFEAIVDGPTRRKNDAWTLYNRSKLVGVHDVIFLILLLNRLAGVAVCRVTLW
jgi:retinol dehydrogenase-12